MSWRARERHKERERERESLMGDKELKKERRGSCVSCVCVCICKFVICAWLLGSIKVHFKKHAESECVQREGERESVQAYVHACLNFRYVQGEITLSLCAALFPVWARRDARLLPPIR